MARPSSDGAVEATLDAVLQKVRIPFIHRGSLDHDGASESVFLLDLGLMGAFVERGQRLPVGSRVVLRFPLPGNEIPVVVTCRVAWWHPPEARLVSKALPAGLGLEFVEISDGDRGRLREHLVGYLGGERGGRRFHRALPLAPEDEGTDP
jgi:Tfp pilus assembly protein PilZ